jgi:cytoskeletal protein CcmA (bactofilin family)
MFRRKEENATDSDTSANPTGNVTDAPAAHAQQNTASTNYAPVTSAPVASAPVAAPASHNYTPASSTAAPVNNISPSRPAAAEAPRPAAQSPVSNYRPSPIAEFNRAPSAARTSEAARPAASVSQSAANHSSSFSSVSEKSVSLKPNRRVLTVGNDILLKGEIATCDRLVIEGRVEAKLSDVHTVEIAEVGSFKGTAEVEDAEISGVFEGDLIVRNRLVIYASGEVRGNISYGEIEIERGGKLTGQIKTVATPAQANKFKPLEATEAKSRPVVLKETEAA